MSEPKFTLSQLEAVADAGVPVGHYLGRARRSRSEKARRRWLAHAERVVQNMLRKIGTAC